jgi:hypothetical protein
MLVNLEYLNPRYVSIGGESAHRKAISYFVKHSEANLTLPRLAQGSIKTKNRIVVECDDVDSLNKVIQTYAEKFYNLPIEVLARIGNRTTENLEGLIMPETKTQTLSHVITNFDKRLLFMDLTMELSLQITRDSETETKGYLVTNDGVSEIEIKYHGQNKNSEVTIQITGYSLDTLTRQSRKIKNTFATFDHSEALKQKEDTQIGAIKRQG